MTRRRGGGDGQLVAEGWRSLSCAILAVIYLVLMLNPPAVWLEAGSQPGVPLEAIVLIAALGLTRLLAPQVRRLLLHSLALGLVVIFGLAVGDTALQRGLGRPLDLPLDIHLAPALFEFAADALRHRQPWLWGVAIVLLGALTYWWTMAAARTLAAAPVSTIAALAIGALLIMPTGHAFTDPATRMEGCGRHLPLSCYSASVMARQLESAFDLWRPLPVFDRALAEEPLADGGRPNLARLRTADVLLVFVESYGTTALRDRRYASTIAPRIEEVGADLAEAGLSVASGRLEAPTVGGLSWLSHATVLSGLWIDNQRLYQRLITSERRTLVRMFGEAGHRTVGIFPQTLRPWPEGRFFGYDQIWTSQNIDYAGPRFGWTTMPDQYTLWFLQWKERRQSFPRPPLFAEVALISSHAPWEPVPSVVEDWQALGTGESLAGSVDPDWAGPEGWPEKAPANYARTLAYSLDSIAGFARQFVDEHTLMIVLGDHQPAPLITGPTEDRSVPVHIIAGDPEFTRPFLEWGFRPSMLPELEEPARRMDVFRDWFVEAFSDHGAARAVSQRGE